MQDHLNAVALTYESALEPEKWPEALDAIAKIGQSKGACLCLLDPVDPELYSFTLVSGSYDAETMIDYATTHIEFETRMWGSAVEYLRKAPEYSVVSDLHLFEIDDTLYDEKAFTEFSERLGIHKKLGVMLNHKAPWEDGLGFQYGNEREGFPEHARKNISTIAPYLARAASLIRPVHILEAEHGMMLNVLERLAIGVAVVSNDGTLILKNASFMRILDLGALYLDPRLKLRAHDSGIDSKLRQSIDGTSKMSVGMDLNTGDFVSVPIKKRDHPISLEISPLGRWGKDSPRSGWSIIFAIDPHWRLVTDSQKLAQSYSLTVAEKEVCSMLLKGLSNREISDVRSCGMETVKSHVSNLLAKTWTSNRTELARLAATTEIPLVD